MEFNMHEGSNVSSLKEGKSVSQDNDETWNNHPQSKLRRRSSLKDAITSKSSRYLTIYKEREDMVFPTRDKRKIVDFTGTGRLIFSIFIILFMVAWSCLCVWLSLKLVKEANESIDGNAAKWALWLYESDVVVKRIGAIFTFATIFRFQECYSRWWEGSVIWGDIVSTCLDLDQMNNTFIKDAGITNCISRFIIVFVYSCKSILRHESVLDKHSNYFLEKEVLFEAELSHMKNNKGWEPHYALNKIRHTVADAFNQSEALLLPSNKMPINAQVLRSLENNVEKLHNLIGQAIRLRETGLPQTYNYVHTVLFYLYFTTASIVWAPRIGWMLPIIMLCFAPISLALIQLGTDLVDPFGTDFVDLPLDFFCQTTELQIRLQSKQKEERTGILKPQSSYTKENEDSFEQDPKPFFQFSKIER